MAANEVFDTHSQPLTHDLVANGVGYTIPPYCDIQSEIESRQLNGVRIRELTITWALALTAFVRIHRPYANRLR
jgi:hypothetical protein